VNEELKRGSDRKWRSTTWWWRCRPFLIYRSSLPYKDT